MIGAPSIRRLLALGVVVASACLPTSAVACQGVTGRPSVGVVLSGGGARAAAQIGVLAELERRKIPVDCIAGTSMGAVVATLYASGHSPAEIRSFFETSDWKQLLLGDSNLRNKRYGLKSEARQHLAGPVLGIGNKGVTLPAGLLDTQNLREKLRARVTPQPQRFDQLRIPLRIIATDLETLDAVEFEDGDLVDAVLASMAVPGLMAPQTVNQRAYVDGGLAKQIGVDTVKKMGADIVIAVDMSVAPTSPGENPSLPVTLAAIVQATNWKNRTEQVELLSGLDVLISPDMTGLSTVGFENASEGYASGVAAAVQNGDALTRIALEVGDSNPPPPPTWSAKAKTELKEIELINRSGLRDKVVLNRVGLAPGTSVSADEIDLGVRRLAADGAVGAIRSELLDSGVLKLTVEPSPDARGSLSLGLEADNAFDRGSEFALKFRWLHRPIDSSGGEIALVGVIGTRYALALNGRKAFGDGGQWSLRPSIGYDAREAPLYLDGRRIDDFWVQRGGLSLGIGRELGFWGDLELAYTRGLIDLAPSSAYLSTIAGSQTETGFVTGRLAIDTFDRVDFPSQGFAARFEVKSSSTALGADQDYTLAAGGLEVARSMSRGVLVLAGEGGWSDGAPGDPGAAFFLGGFRNLTGLKPGQEIATEYGLGRIEYRLPLTSLRGVTSVPVWAGALMELGWTGIPQLNEYGSRDFQSVSGYIAVETPIGPIYGLFGHSFQSGSIFNVTLGNSF